MANTRSCRKCGATNYATDSQCVSCGTPLELRKVTAQSAPPATPPGAPRTTAKEFLTKKRDPLDVALSRFVSEYRAGAIIGLVAACLLLTWLGTYIVLDSQSSGAGGAAATRTAPSGPQVSAAVGIAFVCSALAGFFFMQYTGDPEARWALTVAVILSGMLGWLLLALGAAGGAALEKAFSSGSGASRSGPRRRR